MFLKVQSAAPSAASIILLIIFLAAPVYLSQRAICNVGDKSWIIPGKSMEGVFDSCYWVTSSSASSGSFHHHIKSDEGTHSSLFLFVVKVAHFLFPVFTC